MHLHRLGQRTSPALVLLHGIPGSAGSWTKVADRLASRFFILVPDLLGFGHSSDAEDIHAESQAIALELALEAAGVDRATVVGHDFGGPIALSFYRRRPQFFTALMLLSTNSFPDTSIPFPLSMVNAPVIGRVMGRVLFSTPSLRLMLMRYGGTQLGEARSVRRIFTASLDNLAQLYGDYPGILHSVDVPASVVWGDRDPFFPVAQAERTASLLEDVKLHFLYGAGHFLPEERPEEVGNAIELLVARATERAGAPGSRKHHS